MAANELCATMEGFEGGGDNYHLKDLAGSSNAISRADSTCAHTRQGPGAQDSLLHAWGANKKPGIAAGVLHFLDRLKRDGP
jgi:hypothetical protein